jgi:hypothetical protein
VVRSSLGLSGSGMKQRGLLMLWVVVEEVVVEEEKVEA